jgi:predicted transcriptional regulator
MKVLLSIKPEFADKIFSGEKCYEFRRVIFKKPGVKTIVVYASSPVQKVIGEFEIANIICDNIPSLWRKTRTKSGISENYFYDYFGDKELGFAIKIKKVKRYDSPLCLKKDFGLIPPQSYLYL